jgi:signal transduction histidine kinase
MIRNVSLRYRFLLLAVGLVLLLGVTTIILVRTLLTDRLTTVLQERGVSIGRTLAEWSINPILRDDPVSLTLLARSTIRTEQDIAYIFFLDQEGKVVAHSFGETFPVALAGANPLPPGEEHRSRELVMAGVAVIDVAVPIVKGDLGAVHLGFSEKSVSRSVDGLTWLLLSVSLVVTLIGSVGAALLAGLVTRPLAQLTEAAAAIGEGDLNRRIAIVHRDEVGTLSTTFNRMADNLCRMTGELIDAKQELEVQNEELVKLDEMKDSLIRDVTHELKTPVAKIAMQIELLRGTLAGAEIPEEAVRSLEIMETSVRRQEETIRNILNLSRLESGGRRYKSEAVSLAALLAEVVEEYRDVVTGHDIALAMDLAEVSLVSDREMLWHVFSNLLGNAVKFRRPDTPARIAISLGIDSDRAVVTIADNGIGLTPEERRMIFERFYQAHPSAEGSGVGLTIVRMILTDLGGTIEARSEGKGLGTAMVVTLPLRRT